MIATNQDAARTGASLRALFTAMLRAVYMEAKITTLEYERATTLFDRQFDAVTATVDQMAIISQWSAAVVALLELREGDQL